MLQPKTAHIIIFWIIKYALFYIFLTLLHNNFTLLDISELDTWKDWFYYLWIILFLPVSAILLFTFPIYKALNVSSRQLFVLIMLLVLIAEFFFYTWMASQSNMMYGIYNGIITLVLFSLLFFNRIKIILSG